VLLQTFFLKKVLALQMESTIIKKEKEAGNRISSSKTSEQHVKTTQQFQVSNLQEQQFNMEAK